MRIDKEMPKDQIDLPRSEDIQEKISKEEEKTDYTIRKFKDGDEESLSSLFNDYYSRYSGFSSRTVEHWRWVCLDQPGYGKDGLFVALLDDSIIGYIAFRKPQTQGGIFYIDELCYNRLIDREDILLALITETILYAETQGSSGISIEAPFDDEIIKRACEKLDFDGIWGPRPAYAVVPIDLIELLSEIILNIEKHPIYSNNFCIKINDIPQPNALSVVLKGSKISLIKEEIDEKSITIETDYATINQVIFGSRSILKSILNRSIKIKPRIKYFQGIQILSKLVLKLPWFITRTDQI